jgi:LmbE family N-acetylglucosaminyl deacetylase
VTAIFVFAHQDDEFAFLATFERLVRSGATVHCVYLTDGAFGNQSTERRNRESLRVLASLGVVPSNVHFIGQGLRIPDGSLHAYLMPAFKGLQECIERVRPVDEMYLPAWEGGHQDHDAAHLIGVITSIAFGLLNSTFQISLYNGHRLMGPMFRVMSPLPRNGPSQNERVAWRKRLTYSLLCLSYPSQWKTWLGLFPFALFSYLKHGVRHKQPVSLQRLFELPHPGRLLYERRMFLTSKEFNDAKIRFIIESGLNHQGWTGLPDGNT